MTDDIRSTVASRIAARLSVHPAIEARPWGGTETGAVRVYCQEVTDDGIRCYQRGAVEIRQHIDGEVWAQDCTQEWLDPSAADEVHRVAYALCVAANLRRRRVG